MHNGPLIGMNYRIKQSSANYNDRFICPAL